MASQILPEKSKILGLFGSCFLKLFLRKVFEISGNISLVFSENSYLFS